jgi:UDP-glucuronate decarboxylase
MMGNSEGFCGPVNIGNPDEFTILELAEKVIEITDSRSEIIHEALPTDDPVRRQPDISLAKEKIGWEPTIDLATGLAETVKWFRSIDIRDYRPPTPNY